MSAVRGHEPPFGDHPFISTWRNFAADAQSNICPGDEQVIADFTNAGMTVEHANWAAYTSEPEFGAGGDTRLHLSLVPVPYVGNPVTARVVLLLLNPGLAPTDYFGEFCVHGFRDAVLANLRNDVNDRPYPFFFLNPAYAWHGGFMWWQRKLRQVIRALVGQRGETNNFAGARQWLAGQVAAIELVPYHSESFGLPMPIVDGLMSTELATNFVREELLPKACSGERLLVVMRKPTVWGLEPKETSNGGGVILFSGPQARAAHLSIANGQAGDRIVRFLLQRA